MVNWTSPAKHTQHPLSVNGFFLVRPWVFVLFCHILAAALASTVVVLLLLLLAAFITQVFPKKMNVTFGTLCSFSSHSLYETEIDYCDPI